MFLTQIQVTQQTAAVQRRVALTFIFISQTRKVLFVRRPLFADGSNRIVRHTRGVCHGGAVHVGLRRTFDSELKMRPIFHQLDPWSHTLAMIDHCPGLKLSDRRTRLTSRESGDQVKRTVRNASEARDACATIRILERPSTSTVSLSWHDPTSLNYAEQEWWIGCAPKNGRCAVSGERIVRGQSVYRPKRSGKGAPLNRSAMILIAVIASACPNLANVPDEDRVCRVKND